MIKVKSKIPFVIPEHDINLRVIRFLYIAEKLSYTQKGKLVLNIDKFIIYDFLVKHPYLLKEVVKLKNKKIDLKLFQEEVGSVATLYPSKSSLLDNNSAKVLIKLMVSQDLLKTIQYKNELFFVISDHGKEYAKTLETDYINRIKQLCDSLLVLRSTSTNGLKKMINPLIKGV
ncbi:ABC-three component system middle component 4 [Pseudalkalibacillus sp. A8]|uniref:ABC-three component system middle component 4 n=1 Tax=Pseudalkalibacillus sp. A8 TaxID=3382641 RepID=UPI0038B5F9D8